MASTTNAVAHAIEQSYLQFCLLRNGNIHERLSMSSSTVLPPPKTATTDDATHDNIDDDGVFLHQGYPGMEPWYHHHVYQKQQRRRSPPPPPLLPPNYTSLCRDLQYHFNDWIMQYDNTNCHHWLGGYRNVVECVPKPLPVFRLDHTIHHHPSSNTTSMHPDVLLHILEKMIENLLMAHGCDIQQPLSSTHPLYLIGISTFMNHQLVETTPHYDIVVHSNTKRTTDHLFHHFIHRPKGTMITNEMAYILYHYVTQIQYYLLQQQPNLSRTAGG
jgi:hypothetical protein